MKILKLACVFLIVVAAVVGIMWLTGVTGGGGQTSMPNEILNEYKQDFRKGWSDAGDWDKDLFVRYCKDVETLSKSYDVTELKDFNVNEANDIVYKKIFAKWNSASCAKADVDVYVKAADIITAYDVKMNKNEGIEKLRRVNEVYRNADNLATMNVSLTPQFTGSSWNDFNAYATGIMNRKNSILGSNDYKDYLSNINYIKTGLNSIEPKISAARTTFYNSLETSICRHYGDISPRSRDRRLLETLKTVRTKYENESSRESAKIKNLCSRFEEDVTYNENHTDDV